MLYQYVEQFPSYCQIAWFLRAVPKTFDRPPKKSQRIYQIQKAKNTQGDYLYPFFRFCIRFQVTFRRREKIEGLGSQTILLFSGFESVGIKRQCQGSAVSKNRNKGPELGHRVMPTLGHFHKLLRVDRRRTPML